MKISRYMVGILVTLISFTSFAQPIQVKIESTTGEQWTPAELKLIQKSAELAFERIVTQNVAQCAYRNSFRDDMSRDKLREKWGNQIPILNKTKKIAIKIHKEKLPESILGLARVGIAKVDKKNFQISNLEISLSQEEINKFVKAYSKKSGSDDAMNRWINVIAHEVAHNFGYSHGTKGTWVENYPGYFVTELGFCVVTEGKFGSDLGDQNLRREREALRKKHK